MTARAPALKQFGFGFDVWDSTGCPPPFIFDPIKVKAALKTIKAAQWVSVDVETTGLTDASAPVDLSADSLKMDGSNEVRMRTIQARVPTQQGRHGKRENYVFDTDRMSPALVREVAQAILSRRMFIAHNAGFDLYWLRHAEGRTTMPELVVDSMLMTRLLDPMLVLQRAAMTKHIRSAFDVGSEPEPVKAAWKSLTAGASGGSLADVVLAMFGAVVDKSFQKPTSWTGLLTFGHYDYAVDDTVWADRILCKLFGVEQDNGDLLHAYLGLRARDRGVRLIEPQVPELVLLRENGMPINCELGRSYIQRKRGELANTVSNLIKLEPSLEPFREALADPDAGVSEGLKRALGDAFMARGVDLRLTKETGSPQIGEKDLRACRAAQNERSRPLFNAWAAVCGSKKTSAMAQEVVNFSERSSDGYVRSLLSHGPVTGRLSASEPNVQQFPRDQLFRAMCISETKPGQATTQVTATEVNQSFLSDVVGRSVAPEELVTVDSAWLAGMFWSDKKVADWPSAEKKALEQHISDQFTHTIVASDFGALDVRVGAALCIRAQREMLALVQGVPVPGPVQPSNKIVKVLTEVVNALESKEAATELERKTTLFAHNVGQVQSQMDALKKDFEAGRMPRRAYYEQRSRLKESLLVAKLGSRFAQCLSLAYPRGEREYSALRDAFIAEIDIHTFTGMKLVGRDPMKEFEGLSKSDRKALEKKLKKELGPRRQQGKIANLSLLYGMADAGFQEAAARGYDEHWTLEETHEIRANWLNVYPEVELWHLWTDALQAGTVYLPEKGKEKPVRTGWWMARTLAGRNIVALGLNAALSYQDQSSGADILGLIMHRLKTQHPEIFDCGINQVHDELVFKILTPLLPVYLPEIEKVMVEEANSLTMPYGVPCAVSPACGPIWVKD